MFKPSSVAAADPKETEVAEEVGPAPLVPGSVAAKVLYDLWSGQEYVVVNSPPGAGKTELIVTTVAHLVRNSDHSIVIATPTRAQAIAITTRLLAQVPVNHITSQIKDPAVPKELSSTTGKSGRVIVRTVASCAALPPQCDLMVVDEAYQATYADLAQASPTAAQVLLVGDPGQIGPVITIPTGFWRSMTHPPSDRAPEVVATLSGAIVHNLDKSWRLGEHTVKVIAPLYEFPFASGGVQRDRLGLAEIEAVELPELTEADDTTTMTVIAERVAHLRSLTESVACVVARNSQATAIKAILAGAGVTDVMVGTADKLQGGQWTAVVALDPIAGSRASDHSLSPGRLCVMLSRHTTHLTWYHDGTWRDVKAASFERQREVREVLCREAIR